MKKLLKIVSPSYKRPGNVKPVDLFGSDLVIAVHEKEVDDYKKAYPKNELMVLPDNLSGNMSKVRNHIKDNCGTEYLVMLDDDVKVIGYHEKMRQIPMEKKEIMKLIYNGFMMCEEIGTVLWGMNLQSDPKFYREYSPFSFLQPVLGTFCCIVTDNKLSYDNRFGLNEDYDFAVQVLHKYHKILRFNKYYYIADHLLKKGGCGAYRTLEKEKMQAQLMIKKWGNKVVKYDFSKSTNPRINVPFKGM